MGKKNITILFYAALREATGKSRLPYTTEYTTAIEIYEELRKEYSFSLSSDMVKVSINNEYVSMDSTINENDTLVFIPPVAGG